MINITTNGLDICYEDGSLFLCNLPGTRTSLQFELPEAIMLAAPNELPSALGMLEVSDEEFSELGLTIIKTLISEHLLAREEFLQGELSLIHVLKYIKIQNNQS